MQAIGWLVWKVHRQVFDNLFVDSSPLIISKSCHTIFRYFLRLKTSGFSLRTSDNKFLYSISFLIAINYCYYFYYYYYFIYIYIYIYIYF